MRRQEPVPEQAGFITPDSSFSLRPDRLGLRVQIPPKAWMSVCCNCCVLSGIRCCDKLIPRPEESYRMWCVIVCELETSIMRRSLPITSSSVKFKNEWRKTSTLKHAYMACTWKYLHIQLSLTLFLPLFIIFIYPHLLHYFLFKFFFLLVIFPSLSLSLSLLYSL